MKGYGGVSRG